jgi:hypothetical protein
VAGELRKRTKLMAGRDEDWSMARKVGRGGMKVRVDRGICLTTDGVKDAAVTELAPQCGFEARRSGFEVKGQKGKEV